jgi:branched-chain amino acid aminotransferase
VRPYGPLALDPAASVLHYGQEIFEGIKAYRHADGSIWTFRPDANGARLQRSARRLAMPELPVAEFTESPWTPTGCRARRRPACTSVPS